MDNQGFNNNQQYGNQQQQYENQQSMNQQYNNQQVNMQNQQQQYNNQMGMQNQQNMYQQQNGNQQQNGYIQSPYTDANMNGNYEYTNGHSGAKIIVILLAIVAILSLLCCGGLGIFIYKQIDKNNKAVKDDIIDYYDEEDDIITNNNNDEVNTTIVKDENQVVYSDNNIEISINTDSIRTEKRDDGEVFLYYDCTMINNSNTTVVIQYDDVIINSDKSKFGSGIMSTHIEPYDSVTDTYVIYGYSKEYKYNSLDYLGLNEEEYIDTISNVEYKLVIMDENFDKHMYTTTITIDNNSELLPVILSGYTDYEKSDEDWIKFLNGEIDSLTYENDSYDIPTNENTDNILVGFEGYGYIEIPSDWVKFIDVDNGEQDYMQQYTSRDLKYIITVSKYDSPLDIVQSAMVEGATLNGAYIIGDDITEGYNGTRLYEFSAIYPDDTLYLSVALEHDNKVINIGFETTFALSDDEDESDKQLDDFIEMSRSIAETLTGIDNILY